MRLAQENELATIDNAALRQRFQGALDQLIAREQEKRDEVFICGHLLVGCGSTVSICFISTVRTSDGNALIDDLGNPQPADRNHPIHFFRILTNIHYLQLSDLSSFHLSLAIR